MRTLEEPRHQGSFPISNVTQPFCADGFYCLQAVGSKEQAQSWNIRPGHFSSFKATWKQHAGRSPSGVIEVETPLSLHLIGASLSKEH